MRDFELVDDDGAKYWTIIITDQKTNSGRGGKALAITNGERTYVEDRNYFCCGDRNPFKYLNLYLTRRTEEQSSTDAWFCLQLQDNVTIVCFYVFVFLCFGIFFVLLFVYRKIIYILEIEKNCVIDYEVY